MAKRLTLHDLRAPLDPTFTDLHREVSLAYYEHWRRGESSPWLGYDRMPTAQLSKRLFDRLHASVHYFHGLAQRELQDKVFPGRYPIRANDERAQKARRVMQKWQDNPNLTPLHNEVVTRLNLVHPSVEFILPWR